MYISPALTSHTPLLLTCCHVGFTVIVVAVGLAVGVALVTADATNLIDIALLFRLVAVHVVLKWLHHPVCL